ncbi:MAG: hypothetical protein KDH09_11745, partial [Chrysiogenetes bacterium]|nr:hypothetical protein [Chrysiogenetes bacterium]
QHAERFYVHYRTFVTIDKEQDYSFALRSSGGGAQLRLGNMIVFDDDPYTEGGEGSGRAHLKPGIYPMSLSYYHLGGPVSLQMEMRDESGEPYPAEHFRTLPPGPVSFYGQLPSWAAPVNAPAAPNSLPPSDIAPIQR